MKTETLVLGAVLVVVFLFFLMPDLGILFLVVLLFGILFYYGRPKCAKCGRRGTMVRDSSLIANQVQGYGLVTRTDTVTSSGRGSDGTQTTNVKKINRQERAPTVTTTTRTFYKCSACGNVTSKDTVKTEEDFSRSGQEPIQPVQPTVVQKETIKEVVKVPCKYCKTLLDPVRDRYCPGCGAPVRL